jgi:hypothetical protein
MQCTSTDSAHGARRTAHGVLDATQSVPGTRGPGGLSGPQRVLGGERSGDRECLANRPSIGEEIKGVSFLCSTCSDMSEGSSGAADGKEAVPRRCCKAPGRCIAVQCSAC